MPTSVVPLVLYALVPVPFLGVWSVAMARGRSCGDAARSGVGWLHATCAVLLLSIVLSIVVLAINQAPWFVDEAAVHIAEIANWFYGYASVLSVVVLYELRGGFLRVLAALAPPDPAAAAAAAAAARPSTQRRPLARMALFLGALVLSLLVSAQFGLDTYINAVEFHPKLVGRHGRMPDLQWVYASAGLGTAFWSIILAAAVLYIALAVDLVQRCCDNRLRRSSILYLAATLAWFIHAFYNTFANAYWSLSPFRLRPWYLAIISTILGTYAFVVAMALLCVLVGLRHHGLWMPAADGHYYLPAQQAEKRY